MLILSHPSSRAIKITLTALFLTFLPKAFLANELNIEQVSAGEGTKAEIGMSVSVHYKGQLKNGIVFDDSYKRGQPFTFILGSGQVIQGWEQGIEGMQVGAKRRLTIPPELAYGADGAGSLIPPNSTLIFDVELIELKWPPKLIQSSPQDLVEVRNSGTVIIDIRRPEEWKQTGIIKGSKTITAFQSNGKLHPDFQRKFFSLITSIDTPFLLYCRTGNRTGKLGNALVSQLGFTNAMHLSDGIVGWGKNGFVTSPYIE